MKNIYALVASLVLTAGALGCDLDFNNDGRFNVQDTIDREAVRAGADIPGCDTLDFNGDDVFPDDQDETAWYTAVATGVCPDGFTANRQTGPTITVTPESDLTKALMSLRWSGGTILVSPGVYTKNIRWDDQNATVIPNISIVGLPDSRGNRPVFTWASREPLLRINSSNVMVTGLTFVAPNAHKVIHVMGGVDDVVIEDVVVQGGGIGVSIEGQGSLAGDITINRCIIRDLYLSGSHNQGVYISNAGGVVIRDTVFYNIGEPTQFNQCIYSVHGPGYRTFVNNWFYNPGFAGIQTRGGERYLVVGNVFDRCGNAIGIGHPMGLPLYVSGTYEGNLIVNPKYPFWGIAIQNGSGVSVKDNILLAKGQGYAFQIENTSRSVIVTNTTVSNWDRLVNYSNGTTSATAGITWEAPKVVSQDPPAIHWDVLTSRPLGVWGDIYETTGFINANK